MTTHHFPKWFPIDAVMSSAENLSSNPRAAKKHWLHPTKAHHVAPMEPTWHGTNATESTQAKWSQVKPSQSLLVRTRCKGAGITNLKNIRSRINYLARRGCKIPQFPPQLPPPLRSSVPFPNPAGPLFGREIYNIECKLWSCFYARNRQIFQTNVVRQHFYFVVPSMSNIVPWSCPIGTCRRAHDHAHQSTIFHVQFCKIFFVNRMAWCTKTINWGYILFWITGVHVKRKHFCHT